jgi:2-amino-4-hydroxy-6-hydroxymethyldihydropteridine diphosphokinase
VANRVADRAVARVALSLGSNVGDARANVARAIEALATAGLQVVARSADYLTEPWGPVEQDWFVNACVVVDTDLAPDQLLALCKGVEQELGRAREVRWGPRLIDVDILTYDDRELAIPGLTVPHPHMLERAFVLVPLLDVAPELTVRGERVADAAARVGREGVLRLD